jgi:hypothetical protein
LQQLLGFSASIASGGIALRFCAVPQSDVQPSAQLSGKHPPCDRSDDLIENASMLTIGFDHLSLSDGIWRGDDRAPAAHGSGNRDSGSSSPDAWHRLCTAAHNALPFGATTSS